MVRRASTPKLSEQTLYCQCDWSRYWYAPPAQSRTNEQAALSTRELCRNRGARKASLFSQGCRSLNEYPAPRFPLRHFSFQRGERYTALIPCKNVPFVRSSGSVKIRSLVLRFPGKKSRLKLEQAGKTMAL